MNSAQHGVRDDLSTHWRFIFSLRLARYALLNALVRPGVIEVLLILLHHPLQMSLAQDEEEVQTPPSHTAQKALTVSIGLGCLIRCAQHLNPSPGSYRRERDAVLVVIVPNEKPRTFAKWSRFSQLLGRPGIGGVPGHTKVDQASRAQLNHDKYEYRAEEEVVSLKEITGPYVLVVVRRNVPQVCFDESTGPRTSFMYF